MSEKWFPKWNRVEDTGGRVIAPDERLSFPRTAVLGAQHAVAMFGSTVLAPILIGFDPNLAILMSGIGTLLFFVIVGGRVPSYLGSSFGFIGVVIAATAYSGSGANPNISTALGGIIVCGIIYAIVGLIIMAIGHNWIERILPPVVTGSVVTMIGLSLAPVAVQSATKTSFDSWMSLLTVVLIGLVAAWTKGMAQRLLILIGVVASYIIYAIVSNGFGAGVPIDFSQVEAASWIGIPHFTSPVFEPRAIVLIAPVVIILIAENLGHIKGVSAMSGYDMNPYIGRAFLGDGLATVVAGLSGSTGVTTYSENIGVMAITKVFSTLAFVAAAILAILLGFSPKFGAIIATIPGPVLAGTSIVVFGLIAAAGARIWIQNKVDLGNANNLVIVAATLIPGAGGFHLIFGSFTLDAIGTASVISVVLNLLLNKGKIH